MFFNNNNRNNNTAEEIREINENLTSSLRLTSALKKFSEDN